MKHLYLTCYGIAYSLYIIIHIKLNEWFFLVATLLTPVHNTVTSHYKVAVFHIHITITS